MSWIVGLIIGATLTLVFVPREAIRTSSRRERQIVGTYIVLRLFAPLLFEYVGSNSGRFFTSGGWDSQRYHTAGSAVFAQLTAGLPVSAHAEVPGTGAVELMTGYLYLAIGGPNRMVAVYLWALLATIGSLLFWWATRDLVLQRRNLYSGAVLLAPTLLFWNSTLGKEAPITLGIGCLAVALRLLLMRRIGARLALYGGVGLTAIAFIRPHVTLAFFAAVVLASLLSRSSRRIGQRPGGKFVLFVAVAGGLLVSVGLSSELLRVGANETLIDAVYDRAESTSSGEGGSAFTAEPVRSPLQVPGALAIVLLRPYPWEVRTFFQALATLESLGILVLALGVLSRVLRGVLKLEWNVFTLTAVFYVIVFSSAISSYGNFGLVVRQRMQVWQFVIFLVFSAVPIVRAARRERPKAALTRR